MKSSIIDVPRRHDQADLFGINVYQDALIEYIKLTDTPITIALQGEWGSGKTSLMNQLKYELCDKDDAPYFPVWINTWQHSLMKTPGQAIMSILEGCINQIGSLNPDKQKWEESKKVIGGVFKTLAKVGTKVAVSTIGGDGDSIDELFSGGGESSDISKLKKEIGKMIDASLQETPNKIGFTFYIDDLDRIDPPVAVEILELLKNIFDLEKCVFVLAIDYDVVIKGLRSKFGELTDKNEREFRAFFDKIIQLPFSMPVASYNVDTFLVDALRKIGFFTEEELAKEGVPESLSEIAQLSVGCNPRSLKRLMNTLSLISIINNKLKTDSETKDQNKMLNFALVCMQIAYPYIYNQLTEEPDFKQWNDGIAAKLKLRQLTEDEKQSLNTAEEFDDEWEKVLFRMCQKEIHLSNRAFQVSMLLNKIAEIINDDANLGVIVEATLELSAVTNLKAFDTPKKIVSKQGPRQENTLNGKVYKGKGLYIRAIIEDYVAKHPDITLEQLRQVFPVTVGVNHFEHGVKMGGKEKVNIIQPIEDLLEKYYGGNDRTEYDSFRCQFYDKDNQLIKMKDTTIAVASYWPQRYYEPMRDVCRKLGYTMQD